MDEKTIGTLDALLYAAMAVLIALLTLPKPYLG